MNRRKRDIAYYRNEYPTHANSCAHLFADGAEYARTKFAHRLRTALEFQRKKHEVDRAFAPSTTEVLEELIEELEKDA